MAVHTRSLTHSSTIHIKRQTVRLISIMILAVSVLMLAAAFLTPKGSGPPPESGGSSGQIPAFALTENTCNIPGCQQGDLIGCPEQCADDDDEEPSFPPLEVPSFWMSHVCEHINGFSEEGLGTWDTDAEEKGFDRGDLQVYTGPYTEGLTAEETLAGIWERAEVDGKELGSPFSIAELEALAEKYGAPDIYSLWFRVTSFGYPANLGSAIADREVFMPEICGFDEGSASANTGIALFASNMVNSGRTLLTSLASLAAAVGLVGLVVTRHK